jgi:hypothetical protein
MAWGRPPETSIVSHIIAHRSIPSPRAPHHVVNELQPRHFPHILSLADVTPLRRTRGTEIREFGHFGFWIRAMAQWTMVQWDDAGSVGAPGRGNMFPFCGQMHTVWKDAKDLHRLQTGLQYRERGGLGTIIADCMARWEPGVSHRATIRQVGLIVSWLCRISPGLHGVSPQVFLTAIQQPNPPFAPPAPPVPVVPVLSEE